MTENTAASSELYNNAAGYDTGMGINLLEIRAIIHRQRYIVIACLALAFLIGVISTFLMTPIYTAVSKVQVENDLNSVIADKGGAGRASHADNVRFLNGKIESLKSRKMASRVADHLKLPANSAFFDAMNVEPVTEVAAGTSLQRARRAQIVDILSENIEVKTPLGSNVVSVEFSSPSKKMAMVVANAYAENLILANIDQRYENTSYARKFLEQEIEQAKKRLELSERESINYARDSRIIDASDGVSTSAKESTPKSITTANLVRSNNDLSVARTERIKAAERWEQARRTPLMQLPEVASNLSIQNLQAQKLTKKTELRDLAARYKSGHPAMQSIRSDVSSIDSEIAKIARDVRGGIENEYRVAARQEQSLARAVDKFKSETLSEQNKRVELNLLGREVDTNRTQYQALLERYKILSTTAGVVTNNIEIIDKAEFAKQVSPRFLFNLAIALFCGAAIAGLVSLYREMSNDRISMPDELTQKLGLPLLGVTPWTDMDGTLMDELHDRKSILSEAYAAIRSALDFSTRNGAPKTMLFTSAQPSEGKTTSAIAVAESFAQIGKRVLLIDADFRNPSLHRYLGTKSNAGFVGVLTKTAKVEDAIIRDKGMSFDLMPAGPIPKNPAEILVSAAVVEFLSKVGKNYDHIIIDGPPVMGLADSPQISRAIDGTILIVQSNGAMRSQSQSATRRLQQADANIIGAVLTQFNSGTLGYGEYYGYSYNYANVGKEQA